MLQAEIRSILSLLSLPKQYPLFMINFCQCLHIYARIPNAQSLVEIHSFLIVLELLLNQFLNEFSNIALTFATVTLFYYRSILSSSYFSSFLPASFYFFFIL
ncbi:hypothetical protein FGO68_gene6651 [Halteria grandinella]|uniref:Uncharacterized protein n=1 Tax=Halteria grandinella TaxID=5974 RepID=A0A8J8NWA5_HALGN|nr:hypothetical protein FGO68_gene6651 [Halteria grandinella]